MKITDDKKEYFFEVLNKFLENILSIKWWMIVAVLWATTELVSNGKLTGAEYVTMNTSLLGIVMGMREIFKISKIRSSDNTEGMNA